MDIAYAAVYLASDESRHTTGHNLMVDAGITVRLASSGDLTASRLEWIRHIAGD